MQVLVVSCITGQTDSRKVTMNFQSFSNFAKALSSRLPGQQAPGTLSLPTISPSLGLQKLTTAQL